MAVVVVVSVEVARRQRLWRRHGLNNGRLVARVGDDDDDDVRERVSGRAGWSGCTSSSTSTVDCSTLLSSCAYTRVRNSYQKVTNCCAVPVVVVVVVDNTVNNNNNNTKRFRTNIAHSRDFSFTAASFRFTLPSSSACVRGARRRTVHNCTAARCS